MSELRDRALALTAADAGLVASEGAAWGIVADLGVGNGTATVVALADGTASLYLSSGGGIIGGGEHASVRAAAQAAVAAADEARAHLVRAGVATLPPDGHVRLYVHAGTQLLRSDELNADSLAAGGHPLSRLFHAVNDVITQVRLHASVGA